MTPKFLTHNLKLLFAAHHYVFNSKDPKDIAKVLKVKKSKVQYWMKSYEWIEALNYWSYRPKAGDLNFAEKLWTQMIENGEDLSAIDLPEKPFKFSETGDSGVYALIQSHLFCVDNLTECDIQERLANEDDNGMKPSHYREQDLENAYYWWIFPNASEGLYSKVLARANVIGDLVIGSGEDTCLVIIRHGRLTITNQVSDDVANVHDERLLVCL